MEFSRVIWVRLEILNQELICGKMMVEELGVNEIVQDRVQ